MVKTKTGGSVEEVRYHEEQEIQAEGLQSVQRFAKSKLMSDDEKGALKAGCKTSPLQHGVDSMEPIWNVLIWSFECLHAGTFPLLDENGEELTGRRAANVGRLCGEYNFRLGRRLLGEKQHIWF